MSKEIAIIQAENIQTIVSAASQSYRDNATSVERCNAAGQQLLDAIRDNGGLNDALDAQVAAFIEKARKTVNVMNERRKPLTKLFDDVRKEFTTLENSIDPTKADTIAYALQKERDAYAKMKHEEAERQRKMELLKQLAQQAKNDFIDRVDSTLRSELCKKVRFIVSDLEDVLKNTTLETYDKNYDLVRRYIVTFPTQWFNEYSLVVNHDTMPVTVEELHTIVTEAKQRIINEETDSCITVLEDVKQRVLDRLPSLKANLEHMAQADAEEAARIKKEMEERQAREAAEAEAARKAREEEEAKKAEMAKQQAEMNSLFGEASIMAAEAPKVKVSKKINLLNAEGIIPVFTMWWTQEGCTLSVEELNKMFKKQITFCEKLANKDNKFIQDENVEYLDDVKAK